MNVRILHRKRAVLSVLFTLLLSVAGVTNALAQTITVGDLNNRDNSYDVWVTVRPAEGGTVSATGSGSGRSRQELYYDFDDHSMSDWTTIDADGDGYNWNLGGIVMGAGSGHNGSSDMIFSQSYDNNYGALTPDNYFVSPQVQLGGSITFWACAQDASYAAEHFGVAVSMNSNSDPSDFQLVQEWTMTAKGVGAPTEVTRSGNRSQGNWYQYTVDLRAYSGMGYVAIRHFNCSDMFYLDVDDITITTDPSEPPIGSYLEGETCTLTATPNGGYEFLNWTENGTVVSTDAEYSFTVTSNRLLVARFRGLNSIAFADLNVETICVSHWDTDGDGTLSYDEAAVVTDLGNVFQGNNQITSFAELQYFTGLTSIANHAFDGCSNLVSVIDYLPESITSIGDYAFYNCSGLTGSINLPEALTTIGEGAFYNCTGITGSLVIPDNVTVIGMYAFRECSGLDGTLTIGNSVTEIGGNAFYHCYGLTGELTIPNSVQTIGIGVFIDCAFTGTLTIGTGVTYIDRSAFRRCTGITEVHWNAVNCTFAGGVWDLPVFNECSSLTTVMFADNVETIPDYTFCNSNSLVGTLILPSSLTSIGGYAFYGCSGFIGDLVIPNSVSYIGWEAFNGCTGLDGTLTIGRSVSEIGSYAFVNTAMTTLNYEATQCNSIGGYGSENASVFYNFTTVNFGDNVESIPNGTFRGCTNLTGNLVLPNSLAHIGDQAFYNCYGFESIVLGNSLETIGDQAFYNCYGFESIVMGNSVETIGNEAFRNCSGLRGEITLPESLVWVGEYAFASCDEISTVNYNATNCSVMGNTQHPVFYDCLSLEHINIGENVESIPNYAFKRCNDVVDINVAAVVPPTVGFSTFATISHSIPVYVPCGTSAAYQSASVWNEFTNIQEDCSQFQTQTYTLSEGTNWFSANVEVTLDDLKAALVEALPGTAITIKSRSQNTAYNPNTNRWRGTLNSLDVTQMYMISVGIGGEITLSGTPIDPAEHPITINNGTNWIAFPLSENMTVSNAFAGFAVNGDKVKSRNGNSQYIRNRWSGGVTTLVPGQGYMYISTTQEPRVLTFPASAK